MYEDCHDDAKESHIRGVACHGDGSLVLHAQRQGEGEASVRRREISFNDGIARVEGLVDYTGTEATWPRYEPKAKQFLAHLEKIDGQWLISRIKVP